MEKAAAFSDEIQEGQPRGEASCGMLTVPGISNGAYRKLKGLALNGTLQGSPVIYTPQDSGYMEP